MVFEKLETTFKTVLNILESAPGRPANGAANGFHKGAWSLGADGERDRRAEGRGEDRRRGCAWRLGAVCGEADPRRTRDPGCEGGLRGIQRSLRKFSKFGVWQMFSKFGLCLKTIQSVLNLFENFFELFCFWKCLCTSLWICFESVFEHSVEKLLENVFETCLTIFKTFSKKFQNNSEWLKKSKIDRWTIYNCFP